MALDNPAPEGRMTRREAMLQLLRLTGAGAGTAAAAFWLAERSALPTSTEAANVRRDHTVESNAALPEMVVVQGDDPRALARRAFADLGGIGRFIARHDVVVLKPNIAWDRTPEQAATTNPDVVAETVKQCWQAGAKRVIVTDVSCNEAERCFHRSGIATAARNEGAEVILPDPARFREVNLGGEILRTGRCLGRSSRLTRSSICPSPNIMPSPAPPSDSRTGTGSLAANATVCINRSIRAWSILQPSCCPR